MNKNEIKKILKKFDKDLWNIVQDSFYDDKEHGFVLCRSKKTGNIYLMNRCKGSSCSMKMTGCSEKIYDTLALVHTHPFLSDWTPSKNDIKSSVEVNADFLCIAAPWAYKYKYKCYKPLGGKKYKSLFIHEPKPK